MHLEITKRLLKQFLKVQRTLTPFPPTIFCGEKAAPNEYLASSSK